MTAPKSFRLAVKEEAGSADTPPPVEFDLVDLEGNSIPFTASFPPEGELLLFMAAQSDDQDQADQAGAVLSLLKVMFSEEQYRLLRSWLRSGEMSPDLLADVVAWIVEQWAGFPTSPASASPTSRPSTGTRSTGRAPGKGSTRSVSA